MSGIRTMHMSDVDLVPPSSAAVIDSAWEEMGFGVFVFAIYSNFSEFEDLSDAPWIVDPRQDGAQLDPTEVSPSDDATMVEPEANFEKKGLRE
ncbi:hypothetical protein YC2023_102652 [Brassica napus]